MFMERTRLFVAPSDVGKGGRGFGMRRKQQRVADEPVPVDQLDIFGAADQPVDRGELIGNFIAAETFEAEGTVFLLGLNDRLVRRALADQGFGNVGAALQVLKFIGECRLSPRKKDRSR